MSFSANWPKHIPWWRFALIFLIFWSSRLYLPPPLACTTMANFCSTRDGIQGFMQTLCQLSNTPSLLPPKKIHLERVLPQMFVLTRTIWNFIIKLIEIQVRLPQLCTELSPVASQRLSLSYCRRRWFCVIHSNVLVSSSLCPLPFLE